jgi:hypothetical protein
MKQKKMKHETKPPGSVLYESAPSKLKLIVEPK